MPKTGRVTPRERVAQFGAERFHTDGAVLFCTACGKAVDHVRKQTIVEHMESAKHKDNERRQRRQAEAEAEAAGPPRSPGAGAAAGAGALPAASAALDWARVCLEVDVPLHSLDLPAVRAFLGKHGAGAGGGAVPAAEQLHAHLPALWDEDRRRLLGDFEGNFIAVIAGETTDGRSRPVFNVLFQVLKGRAPGQAGVPAPQLVKTVCLGALNRATISQALISCMVEFGIPLERILAFVADGASYVARAWDDVLCNLWPNCVRIRCCARVAALVGSTWRDAFKQADRLVALVSLAVKVPARRARFLRYLQEQSVDSPALPPHVTRWDTWFVCVQYHARHYPLYSGFVAQERAEQEDTPLLRDLADLLEGDDLPADLQHVAENCGRLVTALDVLQSPKRQVHKVYNTLLDLISWLEHLESSVDNAKGSTAARSAAAKLRQYSAKSEQPAIGFLRAVRALDPEQVGAVCTDYGTVGPELKLPAECSVEWPVYLGLVRDGVAGTEDPIQFWTAVEDRVPTLAKQAVALLQLTVHATDAERSFSRAGMREWPQEGGGEQRAQLGLDARA